MKKGFSLSNFIRKYSLAAFFVVLGMLLVFLDFLTKAYVYHLFPFETCRGLSCHTLPVFHDFLGVDFAISLAFNRGAAWGVFGDFQIPLLFLRMVMIFALFIYLFFFNQTKAAMLPLVLILSGAIGNVIDFFLYGFVIDFFQFNLWGYHFPVFNLADTWITIGVGWLFLASFLNKKRNYA